jgi:hypothetical protein
MTGGDGRTRRRLEFAVAIAEQDGDEAVAVFGGVGDEEVGMAVVIDVGNGDPAWIGSGGKSDGAEAGGGPGRLGGQGNDEGKNGSEETDSHGVLRNGDEPTEDGSLQGTDCR